MDGPKNLNDLTRMYPAPSRGLRAFVLREFFQIRAARRRGWTWPEIAALLEKPVPPRSLATAFSRVARRVAAGDLEPPATTQQAQARTAKAAAAGQAKGGGEENQPDPDSGFRQQQPSKKADTESDEGKWL